MNWVESSPDAGEFDSDRPVGVLLELNDSRLVLVGHVNALRGVCDDCRDWEVTPKNVTWREETAA